MRTLQRLSLLSLLVLSAGQPGCAWLSGSRASSASTPSVTHTTMRGPVVHQGGDAIVWREGMEMQWSVQSASAPANRSMTGKALVGPDGTVELGPYGSVRVAGLTEQQAKSAVANHVRPYLSDPQVALIPVFATSPSVRVQPAPASQPADRYNVSQTTWRPYQAPMQPTMESSDLVVTDPQPAVPAPASSHTFGQRLVSFLKGS